jgi:hypothetical protein
LSLNRNFYVDGITFDDAAPPGPVVISGGTAALISSGPHDFLIA